MKPVGLCSIVRSNEWVLRASVESVQWVKDVDDPDGVAGWIYHLKVKTDYRNRRQKRISVFSPNTTARVKLNAGGEYFVFASRNPEQIPETVNYCDPYSEANHSVSLERKIKKCLSGK